jgi:hypothetical protein
MMSSPKKRHKVRSEIFEKKRNKREGLFVRAGLRRAVGSDGQDHNPGEPGGDDAGLFFVDLAQAVIKVFQETLPTREFPRLMIPVHRRDSTPMSVEALRIPRTIGVELEQISKFIVVGKPLDVSADGIHHLGQHREAELVDEFPLEVGGAHELRTEWLRGIACELRAVLISE